MSYYIRQKQRMHPVAELLLTLPQAVIIPFIRMLFDMDKRDAEKFTAQITRFIFSLMLISCLGMILIGKPLIRLLFGGEFIPAYLPLAFLMPGMIALGIYPILKVDFFGRNMPAKVSALTGATLIINIILNWVTIPRWGICGAAFSSPFFHIGFDSNYS